jgi:hypothetical protein
MKTKIIIIVSALVLMFASNPGLAKQLKNQVSTKSSAVSVCPYAFLPMPPVYNNCITLSWETDTACMNLHKNYQEADTYSVVIYGLVDYSYRTLGISTEVKDVLVCLEYRTSDKCITLDLSMIQADVLSYIAKMEGISLNEIQWSPFEFNAKVKGIVSTTSGQKERGKTSNTIEGPYSDPISAFSIGFVG